MTQFDFKARMREVADRDAEQAAVDAKARAANEAIALDLFNQLPLLAAEFGRELEARRAGATVHLQRGNHELSVVVLGDDVFELLGKGFSSSRADKNTMMDQVIDLYSRVLMR